MVGNAAEEGLMGQIGNPSHVDAGRIIVPAAALCGHAAGCCMAVVHFGKRGGGRWA